MKKGFSMIELVISFGILVIIGSVGLLIVQNLRVQQTLNFEADKLIQTLREAQQNSIGELNLSVWGVHIDNVAGGNDKYTIFYAASIGAASTTYRTVFLPSSLDFVAPASGSSTEVVFLKSTGVPQTAATLTLQSLSGAGSVDIKILGNGNITR